MPLLLALCFLAALPASAQTREPRALLGTWLERTTVCEQVPDRKRDVFVERCQRENNRLVLSRSHDSKVDIEGEMYTTARRGHTCEFKGSGGWTGRDRLFLRNPQTQCEVWLIYAGKRLHSVVTTEEACRFHCGSNGSLNSVFAR